MKSQKPPKAFIKLLQWFCKESLQESILGDLEEQFEDDIDNVGARKARRRFAWNVLRFFRPGIIRNFSGQTQLNNYGMLKNYLKVTWRNQVRNKTFSAINLSGLVIGMAAALILAKYVGFTLIYDQFHENKDRIVKIHHKESKNGVRLYTGANTYWQTGETAKELYPEVLKSSRYDFNVETNVSAQDEKGNNVNFNEQKILSVSSDFLEIFSFEFIQGNPKTALSDPHSVVLTESIAHKYFKDGLAVGKTLKTSVAWGEQTNLLVTAVVKDMPVFSRFEFDMLKSSEGDKAEEFWEYATRPTYLLLDENTDPEVLAAKLSYDVSSMNELKSDQREVEFSLVPMNKLKISETEIMLAIVGFLTLIITWVNFINLTSAKSLNRTKETGVRKVLGSGKREIIKQFVFEGLTINCTALSISVLIVWVLYPYIFNYTDHKILPLFDDPTGINWMFLGLFLFGAIVSSAYPALLLSGLHPISAIKGRVIGHLKGEVFRKALVVAQFCIAVTLIIGIFVISDQMNFMRNKDLGINLDQTLIVKTPKDGWEGKGERLHSLKNEITNLSFVQGVTTATQVPGTGYGQEVNFKIEGKNESLVTNLMGISADFMRFYDVGIIAGQDFSTENVWSNRRGILINRIAAFGMVCDSPEEAISQKITNPFTGRSYQVVGVVESFHQRSLKEKMQSMVFDFNPFRGHISIKINPSTYTTVNELQQSVASIEEVWNKVYTDQAFEYYFLDERFNAQYQSDIKFRELFTFFTGVSIFIACLGLFGLSLFMAQKKQKEVGIRKVFGASAIQIVYFFVKKHLAQMVISVAIGIPVAYLLMNKWLDNYSYRISINYWELIIPSLVVVTISILTIGFHSLKVSFINPAKTLRDE